MAVSFLSQSAQITQDVGKEFAKTLKNGQIFALNGDVGCGKTEFVRGIMQELSPTAEVSSPTFSIVNAYECPNFTVYHFDFYRIKTADELFEIGLEEYLEKARKQAAVVFVEWADMFPQAFGEGCKIEEIKFETVGENERKITFLFLD